MNDVKNTPKYVPHKPQPLWHSFLIAMLFAAFGGFVIGCVLTGIRTGNLPF